MKDRFKFRVPFFNNDDKFIGYDYCDMINGINAYNAGTCYKGDIQLSTGLKDRNGKLIYEGDLLKTDLKRPYNIVVFRNGMFMLECEDTNGIYYDLFCGVCDDLKKDIDSCNHEIIGNIYENKELLKEQKC